MRPTVLLWDIDGTLLSTGGAGRRAMERAFARYAGRPDACEAFSFAGMTDRAIIRAGLEALGREVTEGAIDALLAIYVEILAEEMSLAGETRVHHRALSSFFEGLRAPPAALRATTRSPDRKTRQSGNKRRPSAEVPLTLRLEHGERGDGQWTDG
ncbi:HAD family hydrolase [Sorangium sp. So ce1128]